MTNRYPGRCAKCGTYVGTARGSAAKQAGVWVVFCATCRPVEASVAAAPVGPTRIVVTRLADGEVRVAPSAFLGGDLFATYREAVSGLRYNADDKSQRSSDLALVGRALARLQATGLLLDVSPEVAAAVQAEAASDAVEVASADDRAVAVDAVLKARGLALFPFQRIGVSWLAARSGALLADEMGLGKEQPIDAPVLTPTGWRAIGELAIGERVIGSDGQPCFVTGVFPQGPKAVFEVTFSDGATAECGAEHLWYVQTAVQRMRGTTGRVAPLCELAETLVNSAGNRQHFIPMVAPVQFDGIGDLPLNPYVMGVLLGDGGLSGNSCLLTNGDEALIERVRGLLPSGVVMTHADRTTWRIGGSVAGQPNAVINALRDLGLWGHKSVEKFIPSVYMFASVEDRIELLRGLFDTDGSPRAGARTLEYGTSSERLAADVKFVCESLGMSVRVSSRIPSYTYLGEVRTGQRAYRLNVNPGSFVPFWRPSKLARWERVAQKYRPARSIASVRAIGERECVCIRVDAADHLYVTSDFVVTHNTIQALTALPEAAAVLVVCPAVAKGVWQRECAKWRPDLTPVILSGKGSFRWPAKGELVVINYDLLPALEGEGKIKELPAALASSCPSDVVLVADEAHALKGGKTLRTTRFRAVSKAVRALGGRCWLVSATPLLNRPVELWAVCAAAGIEKEAFGSWNSFVRIAGGREGRYGIEWDPENMDRVTIQRQLQRVMLLRKKTEVLKDLPSKTYSEITVEIPSKVSKLCDAALAAAEARGQNIADALELAQRTAGSAPGFEAMSKARAALALAKFEAALELIENYEEAGEPLVVFSAHRAPIDALGTRSGWAAITGEMPADERTRIAEAFQAGHLKGIAATIKAGGVAITLTRATNAIFIDSAWTPSDNVQAEDRIYRIGTTKPVTITQLVADHALDQRIYELLARKREFIRNSVDAAKRGAEEVVATEAADLDAAAAALAQAQADLEAELLRQREAAAARKAAQDARDAAEAPARAKREADQKEGAARSKARQALAVRAGAEAASEIPLDEVRRGPANAREEWAAEGVRILAGTDPDRAAIKNDEGFNRADGRLGHDIANRLDEGGLVEVEWKLLDVMLRKYWCQIGHHPGPGSEKVAVAS